MKRILSYFGAISLVITSFMISEQTALVVKETDDIMIKIKEESKKYDKPAINATIDGNAIIPGLNGKKVDINKSYNEMKKIGIYNHNYLKYKTIYPKESLIKTYNKYIEKGNKEKNMVSIIFIIKQNDNIDKIIKTINEQEIKVTFLIDNKWIIQNKTLTYELEKMGHEINILNNEKKDTKKKYCYVEDENSKILEICSNKKIHTIKPNIIIKTNLFKETKQKLESGSIIAVRVNERTNEELEMTIKYIRSKGLKLVNISENISEKNND